MSTGKTLKLLQVGMVALGLCLWLTDAVDPGALAVPYGFIVKTKEQAPGQGSTIKGIVKYRGPMASPQNIVTRNDTYCSKKPIPSALSIDSTSHGVKDVIVYLDGVESAVPIDSGNSFMISNKDCAFRSRVGHLSTGQHLSIANDDPIMHNTHIRNGEKTVINVGMVPGIEPISKQIRNPGILKVQCAIHEYMEGFIGVFPHTYHTKTDETGEFLIENTPPGEYEIKIWHEVLGTLEETILVPDGEHIVEVNLEYVNPLRQPRNPIILSQ